MWCIGALTEQYRQRMYDLLALYARPFRSQEPVVCVDFSVNGRRPGCCGGWCSTTPRNTPAVEHGGDRDRHLTRQCLDRRISNQQVLDEVACLAARSQRPPANPAVDLYAAGCRPEDGSSLCCVINVSVYEHGPTAYLGVVGVAATPGLAGIGRFASISERAWLPSACACPAACANVGRRSAFQSGQLLPFVGRRAIFRSRPKPGTASERSPY